MGRGGAPQWCKQTRLVPPELRHRVQKLYASTGIRRRAMETLGVNEHTMQSLLDRGMLREDTIARIEAKLTELGL